MIVNSLVNDSVEEIRKLKAAERCIPVPNALGRLWRIGNQRFHFAFLDSENPDLGRCWSDPDSAGFRSAVTIRGNTRWSCSDRASARMAAACRKRRSTPPPEGCSELGKGARSRDNRPNARCRDASGWFRGVEPKVGRWKSASRWPRGRAGWISGTCAAGVRVSTQPNPGHRMVALAKAASTRCPYLPLQEVPQELTVALSEVLIWNWPSDANHLLTLSFENRIRRAPALPV